MKRNKKKWSKLTKKQLRKKKIARSNHISNVEVISKQKQEKK